MIPTLNGAPLFKECLEALASQEFEGGFELVVIDSGSSDGTAELAARYGRVIRIPKGTFNHGLTRNFAASKTRGEFIALLVQDATPADSQWLDRLVEPFKDSKVAGVYSRQIPRDDCPPLIKARLERWSASRETREVKRLENPAELGSMPGYKQVRLISFDNVSSCVRRSVWEEIPFEERTFGEDTRWSLSALLKGHSIVFEPGSAVYHSHNNGLWYEFKRVYLDHQNWNRLIGLMLFHNPAQVIEAGLRGLPERFAELKSQGVRGFDYLYWGPYALAYSLSQNLAQYMGAHSSNWMSSRPWFERVDRFLRKGV